jgi:hypothetical protein
MQAFAHTATGQEVSNLAYKGLCQVRLRDTAIHAEVEPLLVARCLPSDSTLHLTAHEKYQLSDILLRVVFREQWPETGNFATGQNAVIATVFSSGDYSIFKSINFHPFSSE